jgi:hypothetical protein
MIWAKDHIRLTWIVEHVVMAYVKRVYGLFLGWTENNYMKPQSVLSLTWQPPKYSSGTLSLALMCLVSLYRCFCVRESRCLRLHKTLQLWNIVCYNSKWELHIFDNDKSRMRLETRLGCDLDNQGLVLSWASLCPNQIGGPPNLLSNGYWKHLPVR